MRSTLAGSFGHAGPLDDDVGEGALHYLGIALSSSTTMGAQHICLGRMPSGIAIEKQGTDLGSAPHERCRPCLCLGVGLAGIETSTGSVSVFCAQKTSSHQRRNGRPADQPTCQ